MDDVSLQQILDLFSEEQDFETEFILDGEVLTQGSVIQDKPNFEEMILNVLNDNLKSQGCQLRTDTHRKTSDTDTEYIALKCSQCKKRRSVPKVKEVEGETAVTGAIVDDGGRETPVTKTYSTRTKRIADCPFRINFSRTISKPSTWNVGILNSMHSGHPRIESSDEDNVLTEEMEEKIYDWIVNDGMKKTTIYSHVKREYGCSLSRSDVKKLLYKISMKRDESTSTQSTSSILIYKLLNDVETVFIAKFNVMDSARKHVLHSRYLLKRFDQYCLTDDQHSITWSDEVPQLNAVEGILVLSSISYTTKSQLEIGARYPEVLQIDATCKTNKLKKPLIYTTGLDGDKKTFVYMTSILCDESEASFSYLLHCIFQFFGMEFAKSIEVILTDGDPHLIRVIDSLILSGEINCYRLSCYFHLINQRFLKIYAKDDYEHLIRTIVTHWLSHCYSAPETEAEFFRIWKEMMAWLEGTEMSQQFRTLLKADLDVVYRERCRWALPYFLDLRHLGEHCTSRVESENYVLKRFGINNRSQL